MDKVKTEKEIQDAWDVHLEYLRKMYASPASGFGSGNRYEYHGPLIEHGDGTYREMRLK